MNPVATILVISLVVLLFMGILINFGIRWVLIWLVTIIVGFVVSTYFIDFNQSQRLLHLWILANGVWWVIGIVLIIFSSKNGMDKLPFSRNKI